MGLSFKRSVDGYSLLFATQRMLSQFEIDFVLWSYMILFYDCLIINNVQNLYPPVSHIYNLYDIQ